MSLQIAAQHLAAQGRGPDTTLVHMTPGEVKSLQSIAMAHGGSLTINPKTGLPEAGFLSSLLPMIAGIALNTFLPGVGTAIGSALGGIGGAAGTGILVGGLQAARTGSLKKGLMAGLGAYGGAGLAQGLTTSGIEAGVNAELAGSEAYKAGLAQAQSQAAELGSKAATMAPEAYAAQAQQITAPLNAQREAALASQKALFDNSYGLQKLNTLGRGVGAIADNPSAFFTKDNLKYGAAALTPMVMAPQTTTPAPRDTEQFRYAYNPNRDMPPTREGDMGEFRYFNPSYTRLAADGGLMGAMPVQSMSDRNDAQMMMANGPQMYAGGGLSHLGDYSDGGRLLRGPGDGVSDDIPATIANKRPARLADGEFVVPARIVSELGNGSTDAGARKLYAMMDRVQKNRRKTVGKNKVAVNSRSEKLLPA
jgi:hypothetical protein